MATERGNFYSKDVNICGASDNSSTGLDINLVILPDVGDVSPLEDSSSRYLHFGVPGAICKLAAVGGLDHLLDGVTCNAAKLGHVGAETKNSVLLPSGTSTELFNGEGSC